MWARRRRWTIASMRPAFRRRAASRRAEKERPASSDKTARGGGSGRHGAPIFLLPGTIGSPKGGRAGRMAEQLSEAAVLFADVSGSTKLYEIAGDTVAHAAIEKCVNIMREKTVNAKGRVIKTIGDEVMSAFKTADEAADAAIEMQSAISEMPPVGTTKIGIRIGFNFGPVVERDGDVFGDAVNLAARLSHVATKDQIITAKDTVMRMSPMLKSSTRAITTIQVKGKVEEIQVYELIWQQSEDMTTLASTKSIFKPKKTALRLKVQGNEVILSAEKPAVALGRDASADVVVKERM